MVKTLLNTCLSAICQYELSEDLAYMPAECKQRLLQFFASHDQLRASDCAQIVCSRYFGTNLSELSFFLSHDLTDSMLKALTIMNKRISKISLVECNQITDQGIRWATEGQSSLEQLELRSMVNLTDEALPLVQSPYLHTLDISGCGKITSGGVGELLQRNRTISCLYMNNCSGLDDLSLQYVSEYVGDRLHTFEMDSPRGLTEPGTSLQLLSERCPNISHLSIARFFSELSELEGVPYRIDGYNLRDIDLYGNYFTILPLMPLTVHTMRLSVSGDENPIELVKSLQLQTDLKNISLQLTVREASLTAIDNANALLSHIMLYLGHLITKLHIAVPRVFDEALMLTLSNTPNLNQLTLEVNHLNTNILQKYFAGGSKSQSSCLRSLKICRMRITYRILFAIAKGARNLIDLETSHMHSIDDRFVTLLGHNCRQLQSVNFNGCKWVSDKGLANLARRCPLREVRIRGTACTDKSIYLLAQFCPDLEWISYADYSGRPKFTETALQHLRDSCIERVIC